MEENEEEFTRLLERYKDYTKGLDSGYFDTDELNELLCYYVNLNDEQAINDIVSIARRIHPRSIETQKMQVSLMLYNGEIKKAYEEINHIGAADFDTTKLRLTALLALNKKHEARQLVEPILNDPDTDAEMLNDLALCYGATQSIRQGIDFIKKCLLRFPDDHDLLHLAGQFYDILDKPKLAENSFKTILDSDPFDASAWISLAELYVRWSKLTQALEAVNYAISLQPHDISALHFKADILTISGNTKEAVQVLLDALQEGSDPVSVYISIAHNYMIENQNTKAIEWLDKARAKAPKSKRVLLCYFDAYITMDDMRKARQIIDDMRKAEMAPKIILERLGMVETIEGNFDKARTNYIKALQLDPGNIFLLTKLGLVEWELGHYVATKRYMFDVLDIDKYFIHGYMILSAAYYKLGQYKKMLEIVGDPVFEEDPNNILFFQLCPELKPNFKQIIDAIRNKKDIQPLLVYPATAANNH